MWPKRRVRPGLCLLLLSTFLAWTLLAYLPPHAEGHSAFERSDPPAGAVLDSPPSTVILHFSQGIDAAFSTAEILDPQGRKVDDAGAVVDEGDSRLLNLSLPELAADGDYRVSWRVRSTGDGHVYEGEFTFRLGRSPAEPVSAAEPAAPAEPDPGERANTPAEGEEAAAPIPAEAALAPPLVLEAQTVTRAALPAWAEASVPVGDAMIRWLGLLLLAPAVGPFVFALFVAPGGSADQNGHDPRWPPPVRVLAAGASFGLALVTLVFMLLQARVAADAVWAGGRPLLDMAATSTGIWWTVRGLLALLLGLVALRAPRDRMLPLGLGVSAMLLATFSATSHAAGERAALLLPLDWLHLAAMVAWGGGLATLAILLALGESRRWARELIGRFSLLALFSVGVLGVTGVLTAIARVGTVEALGSTTYGRVLLLKLALFAALLALGGLNRFIFIPRLESRPEPAVRNLRLSVGTELLAVTLVLAAVGVMTAGIPPRVIEEARRSEPLQGSFATGDLRGSLELRDDSDPHQILVSLEQLDINPSVAVTEAASADTSVLAVVRDTGGREIRTVNLPTFDGRRFSAQGDFFPTGDDWLLELVVKSQGRADVVQSLTMPPLF